MEAAAEPAVDAAGVVLLALSLSDGALAARLEADTAARKAADTAARKAAEKAARKERRKASKLEKRALEGNETATGAPRAHGARNEKRCAVFVKWLVDTFGESRLRDEGVLDVAGGCGEVTVRLAHCHAVRCALVEPRDDVDLTKTLLKKVAPRLPHKWRHSLGAAGGRSDRLEALATVLQATFPPLRNDETEGGRALRHAVAASGVLVGMHADGATEAIVDAALAQQKSFAVVPCCVFASYFESRRLFDPAGVNAKAVKTHAELCAYLASKAGAGTAALDFPGRNRVVFRIFPRRCALGAAGADALILDAMVRNEPVIVEGACLDWRATKELVRSDNTPDVEAMRRLFSDDRAPVVDARTGVRTTMKVSDFVAAWDSASRPENEAALYLKDWHFSKRHSDQYAVPPPFSQDWLGDWCNASGMEDYKFCYVGGKGTVTGLHADVVGSYSWSANVCGAKEWWLFPPDQTALLTDKDGAVVEDVRVGRYDAERFPGVCEARCIRFIQYASQVIFVPAGWHHMVVNLQRTISINHNWFNACSIDRVWAYLQGQLRDVQDALGDCIEDMQKREPDKWRAEWLWNCENVLRRNSRINISDFVAIIERGVLNDDFPRLEAASLAALRGRVAAVLEDIAAAEHVATFDGGAGFPTADEAQSWSGESQRTARQRLDRARAAMRRDHDA
ncbi:hypothetical protein M885DRAFT_511525 [Pelagophyceae sp. CCMP2097]|nr:hypothetical protein M885DRAFT_511525 [Pelagophyceae sp. CCMP2097]